jgi:hypothetical protein
LCNKVQNKSSVFNIVLYLRHIMENTTKEDRLK